MTYVCKPPYGLDRRKRLNLKVKIRSSAILCFFVALITYPGVSRGQAVIKSDTSDTGKEILVEWIIQVSDSAKRILFFDENGLIRKISHWNNGEMHGLYAEYFPSGKLMYRLNYKNGIPNDTIVRLNQSGDTIQLGFSRNGKGRMTKYYEDGSISSEYDFEGLFFYSGMDRQYCRNGQLKIELDHSKEIQSYEEFDCDGYLVAKGKMYNTMIPVDVWTFFWPGTQIIQKSGAYSSSGNGKKIGTWKYYDKEGNLEREQTFDDL